jgi:hypothetical protein
MLGSALAGAALRVRPAAWQPQHRARARPGPTAFYATPDAGAASASTVQAVSKS